MCTCNGQTMGSRAAGGRESCGEDTFQFPANIINHYRKTDFFGCHSLGKYITTRLNSLSLVELARR